MRCTRVRTLSVALLLLLGPAAARAQQSTTRGFNAGLHFAGASLRANDSEWHSAGGIGLLLGYGFNQTIELYVQADASQFYVDDAEVTGDWGMAHGDLGVRFHFANSLRSWVPYLQAALTGFAVGVDNAVVEGQPSTDVSFLGGSFTLGGGVSLYFNQKLAADLQLQWSSGQFDEVKVNDVTVSDLNIDAKTTRFNIGLSWWP